MYTIGKFSQIGAISTSTLRFYDEINLLKPAYVDQVNGYRYYSEARIADIHFISDMREFGFSLEEIKFFLNCNDKNLLVKAQKKRLEELLREEKRIANVRHKLMTTIENMNENEGSNGNYSYSETMEVRVVTLEECIQTAGITFDIPKWPPENPDVFEENWITYWGEDITNKIPNKKFPAVRYGILHYLNGSIKYFITDEVVTYDDIPDGIIKYDIPKGTYAVCTFNAKTFEQLVNTAIYKSVEYMCKYMVSREWLQACR
jgi:DNA-binding transcriptional MerR regulator